MGYVEDGREIFDEELADDALNQNGKGRTNVVKMCSLQLIYYPVCETCQKWPILPGTIVRKITVTITTFSFTLTNENISLSSCELTNF